MSYEKGQFNCPVESTLFLIGGKYKPLILWYLIEKPLHYMELQRLIPKATPKMLAEQLKELESDGIINRVLYPVVPPKTEYSLTVLGNKLCKSVIEMYKFGIELYSVNNVRQPCSANDFTRLENVLNEL